MITGNYQFSPAFGIGGRRSKDSKNYAPLGSTANPLPSGSDSYTVPKQVKFCGKTKIRPSFFENLEVSHGRRATNEEYNQMIAKQEARIAECKELLKKIPWPDDKKLLQEKINEAEYWRDYLEFRRDCT